MSTTERKKYRTTWTKKGYRLNVQQLEAIVIFTVEQMFFSLAEGQLKYICPTSIEISDFSSVPEARAFVAHALAFYKDEELVAAGMAAVDDLLAELKEMLVEVESRPRGGSAN
jgi:uncharacterized lipoprotein YajG